MDRFYALLEAIGYPHPIHPQFTHIPIGMVVGGAFLLGLLSLLLDHEPLRRAARYCAIVALVFVLPTGFFGVSDWQHFFAGGWLQPVKIKLILAGLLVMLLAAALIVGRPSNPTSGRPLVLYALSLLAVIGLGYFGGDLAYEGRSPRGRPQFLTGERIFRGNCSGCHPYGANIVAPASPLRGAPQLKDFPMFLRWVRDPRLSSGVLGIMPAFAPPRISDDQAGHLYAYIINVIGGTPQAPEQEGQSRQIRVRTDPESVKRGQALFTTNCVACHTTESTETVEGPGLKGILKRPQLPLSGRPATPENVYRQLRDPYKMMPSFKEKLSDDEVSDLIAFLATK